MEGQKITPKEIEILQMLANDIRTAEVALKLNVSVRTLEDRIRKMKAKMTVKSIGGAIAVAFRQKIIK